MNTRPDSRKLSLISKVLLTTLLCLLGLLGTLSYAVLGGGQVVQSPSSRGTAFQVAQFRADVRTVAAAISYLLEAEAGDLGANPERTVGLKNSPAVLRTIS